MANKDTVKQWFETGDYPTQGQFEQWIEWQRWKDEQLVISDVAGLADYLNNIGSQVAIPLTMGATKNYTIPAGYSVYKIYLNTDYAEAQFFIGDSDGASDLLEPVDIVAGATIPVTIDLVADVDREIWFSVPVVDFLLNTRLKIYLQKI